MTDKCSRDHEHQWEHRACGHCWCKLCHGFVDTDNLAAIKGPGPAISCNRKPLREYKTWVRVHSTAGHKLDKAMWQHLPPG